MKDLQNYYLKCLKELSDIGIKPGNIKRIYVNKNFKSTWGRCHYNKKENIYEIQINPILVQDDTEDISLKNTIIHEILHTCEGALNHGPIWKSLAEKVNKAYPEYNIKRTTSSKEKNVKVEYKYVLECKNCKKTFGFHRMCKYIKYSNAFKCKCGGNFKVIYN